MEKSAKRISSIFSLSSNTSDTSGKSGKVGSLSPKRRSRHVSPAKAPQVSTDIRPSASTPNLRNGHSPIRQSPAMTPSFDPVRSATPEGSGLMLPPLDILKPLPNRFGSPDSSVPASRPESRASSRGGSRPASPTKFRPLTPTQELKQVSKRKSWLSGRSRPGTRDGDAAINMPLAWVLTAVQQEKVSYDPTQLAQFQRVCLGRSWTSFCKANKPRSPNCGTTAAIVQD